MKIFFAAALVCTISIGAIRWVDAQGPATADPPIDRVLREFGTRHFRHGSRIQALAFSPNGRILAAGGGDDPIRLWDTDTGRETAALPQNWVSSIVFTPRGGSLAAGDVFKLIKIWETASGKESNKLENHTSAIKALAMSPDGTMIASGSQDGTVILWDTSLNIKVITQFKGHTDEVTCLAFSDDSSTLASGSGDHTVRVWNVDNGKLAKTLAAHCAVSGVAVGPGGRTVAAAGDDNLIHVWNLETGKERDPMTGHTAPIAALALSRDGKTLFSSGQDNTIRMWDFEAGTALGSIPCDRGDGDVLALSKDGKFLAWAGSNNTVHIYNIAKKEEVIRGSGHQAPLTSIALSRSTKLLASASAKGEIKLWNLEENAAPREWSVSPGEPLVSLAPDGQTLAVANREEGVILFDLEGKELARFGANKADAVLAIAFTPDGKSITLGRRHGPVEVWSVADKKITQTTKVTGPIQAMTYSADGAILAAASGSTLTLTEDGAARPITTKDEPAAVRPVIAALAFNPDRKTIAASYYDGVIRLYDVATGKQIQTFEGHGQVAYGLAFSADGRILASASFDKTVRLWEAFSGKQIRAFHGHLGPVTALALSPDGRSVYSASTDTNVLEWDATGMRKAGTAAPKMNDADVQLAWNELANEDASRAGQAIWKLVFSGKESIQSLGNKVYLIDPAYIDQLFADLESDVYTTREKATSELEKYGRWVETRLQGASSKAPPLETHRRIERLLGKLNVPNALTLHQEQLRMQRLMLILEQVADDNAMMLLGKLAKGAPEPMLQQDAAATIARVERRAK